MPAPPRESDKPAAVPSPPRVLRPRDAATLVVVDSAGHEARVLMGRRREDLVFMPGKYVFPGGRVDAADRQIACADCLLPTEERKLLAGMKGTVNPDRARALALAAVRETFEEAGLLIGEVRDAGEDKGTAAASRRTIPASWQPFIDHGLLPRVGALTLFARAITPPGRPRRYDTRFFALDAGEITRRVTPPDSELTTLDWFTLDEARRLNLPSITRAVVEDLADRLALGLAERTAPVPYYYFRNGSFHRELITV